MIAQSAFYAGSYSGYITSCFYGAIMKSKSAPRAMTFFWNCARAKKYPVEFLTSSSDMELILFAEGTRMHACMHTLVT